MIWSRVIQHRAGPWILATAALAAYLSNGRCLSTRDALPARWLPMTLIQEGNLDYDEYFKDSAAPRPARSVHPAPLPFGFIRSGGHVRTFYPLLPGLVSVPVYAAGLPFLRGHPEAPIVLEKISASLLAAGSVLFIALALRRMTVPALALGLAAAYAFGTSVWVVASQALWQHTPSVFFTAMGLWALASPPGVRAGGWPAGLAMGLAVWSRPTNVVMAPAWICLAWRRTDAGGRPGGRPYAFSLAYLAVAAAPLISNLLLFGDPIGPYRMVLSQGGEASTQWGPMIAEMLRRPEWTMRWGETLTGLLVSPNRGLLVYSPVLLFSFIGAWMSWRRLSGESGGLFRACTAASGLVVALYMCRVRWDGGWVFGYRYLVDILPCLMALCVPAVEAWAQRRLFQIAFGLLLAWSVAVQALGAARYDYQWDAWPNIDLHLDRVWDWRRPQIMSVLDLRGCDSPDPLGLAGAFTLPANDRMRLPVRLGRGWHIPTEVAWARVGCASFFISPQPAAPRGARSAPATARAGGRVALALEVMTRVPPARRLTVDVRVNGVAAGAHTFTTTDWEVAPVQAPEAARSAAGAGEWEIELFSREGFRFPTMEDGRVIAFGLRRVVVIRLP